MGTRRGALTAQYLARQDFRDRAAKLGLLELNVAKLADHVGVSRETVYAYLNGRTLTPECGQKLAAVFEGAAPPKKPKAKRRAGERARSAA